MASQNEYTGNFDDISVRGRYNRSNAGHGPTISVFVKDREAIRADFFPDSPQGPHHHENPYANPSNPVATVVKVDGIKNNESLLEHIVETLPERLCKTGEHQAAECLTPADSAEVGRFIAAMYYELNRIQDN